MGQFGNQPDFATNDIKEVAPDNNINQSKFLDSSIIYIGDNATVGTTGCMVVIPAGTVGPSVVTALSSPGYAGSRGTGYGDGESGASAYILGDDGTIADGLEVDFTSVNGQVVSVTVAAVGTGYSNGDLVFLDEGDENAVFRVVAAPGLPTADQSIAFYGLQAGGFLPVTVDYVLATNAVGTGNTTDVSKLIAAR
jgi:hypothetical protein